MFKITKLILLLAFLLMAGIQPCFSTGGGDGGDVVVIVVGESGGGPIATRPRMPANRPLLCVYNVDSNALTVTSRNRPLTSVQVQNLTTGEMFSDQCFGNSSVIYLSGTSGLWQVTITLDDDSIHIGMFDC